MKRTIYTLAYAFICFLFGTTVSAQTFDQTAPMTHRHEVKLNLVKSIFVLDPEVEYEYVLKPDMSIGGRLSIYLGNDDVSRSALGNFQAMPYFRWYFTATGESDRKVAKGFFAEINMGLTSYPTYNLDNPPVYGGNSYFERKSSVLGIGLGLSAGWKYISQNGWTCDLVYGGGRNFSGTDIGFYFVGGITIGKRF